MLDSLFNPKGVAVIGASGKELHIGNRVIKNLLDFGYQGGSTPSTPRPTKSAGSRPLNPYSTFPGRWMWPTW